MNTIPFDTLQFAAELMQGGFTEAQAKTMTKAVTKIQQESFTTVVEQVKHDYRLEDIATKRDLKETELKIELVKSELKRDIESVRKEIAETKADLVRWVVGVGVLQMVLITALVLKMASTH